MCKRLTLRRAFKKVTTRREGRHTLRFQGKRLPRDGDFRFRATSKNPRGFFGNFYPWDFLGMEILRRWGFIFLGRGYPTRKPSLGVTLKRPEALSRPHPASSEVFFTVLKTGHLTFRR